jgi:thioesterase domain-containing protein
LEAILEREMHFPERPDGVGNGGAPGMPMAELPIMYLLPGIIDSDPDFDRVWNPLRNTLRIVKVSYLDWTELIIPGADIASVISHVKRQIEIDSPTGPIRLAGFSFGGYVAYACALAFQSAGRSVACLAIVDAPAIKMRLPWKKRFRSRIQRVSSFDLRAALASTIAKFASRKYAWSLLRRFSRFRSVSLPLDFGEYLHAKITMQLQLQMCATWSSTVAPSAAPLVAPTFIYRSTDLNSAHEEDLGWGRYCSNCKVIRVPGDHLTMLFAENNGMLLSSIRANMTAPEAGPRSLGRSIYGVGFAPSGKFCAAYTAPN